MERFVFHLDSQQSTREFLNPDTNLRILRMPRINYGTPVKATIINIYENYIMQYFRGRGSKSFRI